MWEIFLFFCVLILSLIGLCEILHRLWMLILKPKTDAQKFLILLLKDENAQQQLNFAQEHLRWAGKECANGIIAVDCGLKKKPKIVCNGDCRQCNSTKIFTYDEILQMVKRENVFNDTDSAKQL